MKGMNTMTTLEQAARQALEALIWTTGSTEFGKFGHAHQGALKLLFPAIEALRQALEQKPCDMGQICLNCQPRGANGECPDQQLKQEPMAHLWECIGRWSAYLVTNGEQAELSPPDWLIDAVKAATAPPQRYWVGLTDEEIDSSVKSCVGIDTRKYFRAIEAALKEKNA